MPEQRYHLCAPAQLAGPAAPVVRAALPPALRGSAIIEAGTADDADLDLVLTAPAPPTPLAVAGWLNAVTPPGEQGWVVWLGDVSPFGHD